MRERSSRSAHDPGTLASGRVRVRAVGLYLAAVALSGCDDPYPGYVPASAIAKGRFLKEEGLVGGNRERTIKLWGFVDHGNLYGDAGARQVLKEWWSGEGPHPDAWRFDLKARPGDPVGRSFSVLVPNDSGRDELLRAFVADARAGRPTQVFVIGRMLTFKAPTQLTRRRGLSLEAESSRKIRLASSAPH